MGLCIADGFTLDGLLPSRCGVHGEVRFKYRPALPERVVEFLRADTTTPAKEMNNTCKFLLEQLVSWEDDALLSEGSLRHCLHADLTVLVNHCTGYSGTDWSEREKN